MNEDNQSYAAARRIIKMMVEDGVIPEGTMVTDQLVEFVKKRWGSLAPLAHLAHGVPAIDPKAGWMQPDFLTRENAYEHQGGQLKEPLMQ